ncbi:MAG: helix-turn-helix transcriptional regulator [Nitrospiraceae bacterium]
MPRGDQVTRQWRLVRLLEGTRRGYTFEELAIALDCSPRTVMRDLEQIQWVGFPVAEERDGKQKLWRFVEGYKSDLPVPLALSELMALHFSRALLKPLDGTPLQASLDSAYAKIRALLPREAHVFLDQMDGSLTARSPAFKDYSQARHLIEAMTAANIDTQRLEISYYSFSREALTTRRIDPYRLFYYQGGLYVVAHDHLRGEVRIFALERIRDLQRTGETFTVPTDFDFEVYMRSSFGILRGEIVIVRIRFSRHRAKWIAERTWHESQQIQWLPEGALLLSLEVADTAEIKSWILGFGQEAEVLEPPSLREEVRAEAEALIEKYAMEGVRAEIPVEQLPLPVMVAA